MKNMVTVIFLLVPVGVSSNPVLDNLDFVKYMADLSEACRSEVRIKGKKDVVCWLFEQQISEMDGITARWKSLTQEEDDEVRIYSEKKPLNLIHMRENYEKYLENTEFIKQVE